MNRDVQRILEALHDYEENAAESVGVELRLDLSQIILSGLRRKNWTQRELANRTALKESYISRVLHSNANCTFDTAGKLLFALGVRVSIQEKLRGKSPFMLPCVTENETPFRIKWEGTHGQESHYDPTEETHGQESHYATAATDAR